MKVAVATNTGDIVGQHFGRVQYFKIFTIEKGEIIAEELREKPRVQHHHDHHHHSHDETGHGFGPDARGRHLMMIEPIRDCEVLIAGQMGAGAYYGIQEEGIRVILTDRKFIKDAIEDFINGKLEDKARERIH